MTTAQDLFASALKEAFAPTLRGVGLKGSGRGFLLPSESHFALIGFQKSVYSDTSEVRFTINLKVVSRAVWERMQQERPDFPSKPAPSVQYGSFEWNKRIGMLLPEGEDKWWAIRVGRDNRETIDDVSRALTDVAVPALLSQIATRLSR